MKKRLTLVFFLLTLLACDTASVDLSDAEYEFNGRGGVKCDVDGVEFKPRLVVSPGPSSQELEFESDMGEEYLNLRFNKRGPDNELLVVSLLIKNVNPYSTNLTGMVFDLNDNNNGMYTVILIDEFSTNLENIGEFEIVYHDHSQRILAGRFWYNAVNSNNVVKEIRNGEFDMMY